jgi:Bacterial PH domain
VDIDRRTTVAFRPDRRYTVLSAVGAAVALVLVLVLHDPPGRVLAGVGLAILAAYAVGDLVFSPRLTASSDGVVVRSPLLRARLTWPEIEDVRADSRVRYGLRSSTLEVDAGAVLAVFSRRALGADPEEAAALVRACRPT